MFDTASGCRPFDGSRAEGFPRGGEVSTSCFFEAGSKCLVHDVCLVERSSVGWEKSRELGAWRISCHWSTCKVLVVIILIVNEAQVTWRSCEVSHKLSKEAVRGLMLSLLPLPISLVMLILKNLTSIFLKGLQHFGVLYRSIWCELGPRAPIDSDVFENLILIIGEVYMIKSDLKLSDWQALAAELKEALQRKEASWAQSNNGIGTVWHFVDGLGRLVDFCQGLAWIGLALFNRMPTVWWQQSGRLSKRWGSVNELFFWSW